MSVDDFELRQLEEGDSDADDFGFARIGDWEQHDEVDPIAAVTIEGLTHELMAIKSSRDRAPSHSAEIALDFARRLEIMAVEGARTVNRWNVRKLSELAAFDYALEDFHYNLYAKRREKTRSPYISLSYKDIQKNAEGLNAEGLDITAMQRRQTFDALFYLQDELGIRDRGDRLYQWASSEGHQERKYWLRCLHRLLSEGRMQPMATRIKEESKQRTKKDPLIFEDIVARSLKVVDRQSRDHMKTSLELQGSDERMWHLMESRDLERLKSFSQPLSGIPLENL